MTLYRRLIRLAVVFAVVEAITLLFLGSEISGPFVTANFKTWGFLIPVIIFLIIAWSFVIFDLLADNDPKTVIKEE